MSKVQWFPDPDIGGPAFKGAPYSYWAHLRASTRVHRIRLRNGSAAWLVSRYEDAIAVLGNPQLSKDPLKAKGDGASKPPWLPGPLRALSRNMLDLDEPDHRRLRSLVQKSFTTRIVDEMRPRIERIASDLLDAIERRGRNSADLIAEYAAPIPVTVIAELLGVANEDRPKFHRWSNDIVAADTSLWHKLRAIPIAFAFVRFLRRLIRERRHALQDDLLSRLIEVQDEGDHLSGDELLSMCFLLLIAGHETTVNLIGNGLLALLEHPEQMQRLREQPALIPSAIEEMLRFSSPVQLATEQYATAAVTIGDMTIPRGALVYVVLASANRDDKVFPSSTEFEPDRQPNRHLAFGHGVHYCLGAPLARVEGEIAIRLILQRFTQIRLARPASQITWRRGVVLRGVVSLPVTVSR